MLVISAVRATVPELSGRPIRLSFVGSTALNVVSKLSAVAPSNTIRPLSNVIPVIELPVVACKVATSVYSSSKF